MPIADHVDGNNSRQSIADRRPLDSIRQACDPRLEAIVGSDRQDDGLVHNHDWTLRESRLFRPNAR